MGGLKTKQILALPSRVNAVKTLHSAFPAFMMVYMDPKLGGLFAESLRLFWLQVSPKYTNTYAVPDLGVSWNRRD